MAAQRTTPYLNPRDSLLTNKLPSFPFGFSKTMKCKYISNTREMTKKSLFSFLPHLSKALRCLGIGIDVGAFRSSFAGYEELEKSLLLF